MEFQIFDGRSDFSSLTLNLSCHIPLCYRKSPTYKRSLEVTILIKRERVKIIALSIARKNVKSNMTRL